ncbi:GL25 protein, partial [Cettia cetti]|nr:GL25 protein [Cettia cetti]
LQPEGGVAFIRTFQKPQEDQTINLPPNLQELVHNASFPQSPEQQVWKYFYDLPASAEFPFPGGIFQWARFRKNGTGLTENQQIYSRSISEHEDALTLATLRIFSNALGVPHFHFNANEMGVVLEGCGLVGVVTSEGRSEFTVNVGDVVFFPVGSQHFIQSFCQQDLQLLLAYSTQKQLETLRLNQYFPGTADHILAQLFFKKQEEFQKIPKN